MSVPNRSKTTARTGPRITPPSRTPAHPRRGAAAGGPAAGGGGDPGPSGPRRRPRAPAPQNEGVTEGPRPWKRLRTVREEDYQILQIREDVFADPPSGEEHTPVVT